MNSGGGYHFCLDRLLKPTFHANTVNIPLRCLSHADLQMQIKFHTYAIYTLKCSSHMNVFCVWLIGWFYGCNTFSSFHLLYVQSILFTVIMLHYICKLYCLFANSLVYLLFGMAFDYIGHVFMKLSPALAVSI